LVRAAPKCRAHVVMIPNCGDDPLGRHGRLRSLPYNRKFDERTGNVYENKGSRCSRNRATSGRRERTFGVRQPAAAFLPAPRCSSSAFGTGTLRASSQQEKAAASCRTLRGNSQNFNDRTGNVYGKKGPSQEVESRMREQSPLGAGPRLLTPRRWAVDFRLSKLNERTGNVYGKKGPSQEVESRMREQSRPGAGPRLLTPRRSAVDFRLSKLNKRTGNVYENKGAARKAGWPSGNVLENKDSYVPEAGILLIKS